jgi:HD-like signal output (HDOD) protein
VKSVLLIGNECPPIPDHSWVVSRNPAERPSGGDVDVAFVTYRDESTVDLVNRFRSERPLVPCVVTRRQDQPYNLDLARQARLYVIASKHPVRNDWFLRKAVGLAQLPPELEKLDANDLPVLPASAMEIIDGLDNPDISPQRAAELVAKDPAIAARVMALANSSYYSMPRRISTTLDATILLGLAVLRRTVLAVAVFSTFEKLADPAEVERIRQLSLLRTKIASKLEGKPNEELATASLLMDVGRLAQLAIGNQPTTALFPTPDDLDAEAARNGMDSGMIAARLLELWRLPAAVTTAVAGAWWPEPSPANRCSSHVIRMASALAAEAMGEHAEPSEPWLAAIGQADRYHEWRDQAADLAIRWPAA